VFLRSRGFKNIRGRVHMGRIRWGRVISRSWRLRLKSGQEGEKVCMALSI